MKLNLSAMKRFLMGAPLDPFRSDTRHSMALITFFAWIGIGADGLSSANYGPEEAFLALAGHTHLAVFLALATAFTVFLIAAAYTQVIELFPNGGGGYRVASTLLGPKTGLVAGGALLIDYVLTIAISIASGVDALFSMLPTGFQDFKLTLAFVVVGILTYMNLRGMKESIRTLLPIFMGFVITHAILVIGAIFSHSDGLTALVPDAVAETQTLAGEIGWFAVLALFFKAFSLGGGTYTGLEAVSNSVGSLAEPKVRTGKATMWAIAFSLAFMAAGIIAMYLLWDVTKVDGETLNATAFKMVTADWSVLGYNISAEFTGISLIFAAGLLFVAANTGFIAGPNVMAVMAIDRWMPHMFSSLSNRLVTKNGVLMMGAMAVGALLLTGGEVHVLVVMYSINVFLTFTLSLAGITRHRWRERSKSPAISKLLIAFFSMVLCGTILIVTILEKFSHGAWKTMMVTGIVIAIGLMIRRHYDGVRARMAEIESELSDAMFSNLKVVDGEKPKMDPREQTAVFLVGSSAMGIHTFLWVQRLFPGVFKNFIFVSVGEIDTEEFGDEASWHALRRDTKTMLKRYVDFCTARRLPATYYHDYGTDVVSTLSNLNERIASDFPHSVFFAAKLIFEKENMFTSMLHNQTAYMLQKKMHAKSQNLIIMPMKI